VLDGPPDLARPLGSNHQARLDSCLCVEFAFLVDVLKVEVDVLDRRLKQLGHEGLRQPDRLALEAALDARAPVLGLVEDQLAFGRLIGEFRHGCRSTSSSQASCDLNMVSVARYLASPSSPNVTTRLRRKVSAIRSLPSHSVLR
jgi:hypothetical protein